MHQVNVCLDIKTAVRVQKAADKLLWPDGRLVREALMLGLPNIEALAEKFANGRKQLEAS